MPPYATADDFTRFPPPPLSILFRPSLPAKGEEKDFFPHLVAIGIFLFSSPKEQGFAGLPLFPW